MAMDIDALIRDAEWLPHRLAPNGAAMAMIHVPRARHREISFLDDQYLGQPESRVVPFERLPPGIVEKASLHYVFHSAFCCSTLLVRALDIDGVAMGLNEPAILNQAAALLREGRSLEALLANLLPLLARPFAPGETVIAKPSNVANILIDRLMAARPSSKAILLHAPIEEFLASVAKKGMWGRIWMRRFHALVMRSPSFDPGFSQAELFEQTDLQIAATAWLQQQAHFAALLRRFPGRFRSLTSVALLGEKARTLAEAGAFLGLSIDAARAEAIASGPIFSRHSKMIGQDYDDAVRADEQAALRHAHGEEIDMVSQWTSVVAKQFGIPMSLPAALI